MRMWGWEWRSKPTLRPTSIPTGVSSPAAHCLWGVWAGGNEEETGQRVQEFPEEVSSRLTMECQFIGRVMNESISLCLSVCVWHGENDALISTVSNTVPLNLLVLYFIITSLTDPEQHSRRSKRNNPLLMFFSPYTNFLDTFNIETFFSKRLFPLQNHTVA